MAAAVMASLIQRGTLRFYYMFFVVQIGSAFLYTLLCDIANVL